jgi:protein-tyrosine-phosphatase
LQALPGASKLAAYNLAKLSGRAEDPPSSGACFFPRQALPAAAYSAFSRMPGPGHILIVCTANICRSPMAAGLLSHFLAGQSEPLRSLTVVSAGIAARHGDAISDNAAIAMKKAGVDLSAHISQPVTQQLLDDSLVVFCMTESQRAMIQLQFERVPKHLYLFRQFLPPPVDPEVDDPYGGPLSVYETCRDNLVEAVPSVVNFLKTIAPAR